MAPRTLAHRTLALVLLVACAADVDSTSDERDGVGASSLASTREEHGVLRLLNDGEGTTFVFLDDVVALDRRAAANLVEHRDGPDATFGTEDDDGFDDIAEVDGVAWVGPAALATLAEFARLNDYLPGDDELLGVYDGVHFTYARGEAVLAFANTASEETLRDASVPSRAITSIVAARPIDSVATLAELYWVGERTLEHLVAAVTDPATVEAAVCESHADCDAGLRCVGKPSGFSHGKCRDTSNREGLQDGCAVDSDCMSGLVCIAESVYGAGYCTYDWMRETFEVGGVGSIPSIVMSEPTAFPVLVFGQASVPEDVIVEVHLTHSDPTSLWIGLQPPTGQEAVTLWNGPTATGAFPGTFVDRAVYRDDSVNGEWALLVQNVEGRGEGELAGYALTVSSRWD